MEDLILVLVFGFLMYLMIVETISGIRYKAEMDRLDAERKRWWLNHLKDYEDLFPGIDVSSERRYVEENF